VLLHLTLSGSNRSITMVSACVVCSKKSIYADSIKCARCAQWCHFGCLGYNLDKAAKKDAICKACFNIQKPTNPNNQRRSSVNNVILSSSLNKDKAKPSATKNSNTDGNCSAAAASAKQLIESESSIDTTVNSSATSKDKSLLINMDTLMEQMKKLFDEKLNAQNEAFDQKLAKQSDTIILQIKGDITALDNRVTENEERICRLEDSSDEWNAIARQLFEQNIIAKQYSYGSNVEIIGIPTTENENLFGVANELATMFNYNKVLDSSNAIIHRLSRARNGGVVIQFMSKNDKYSFLAAKIKFLKDKRSSAIDFTLNSSMLYGMPVQPILNIFINDHLCKEVKSMRFHIKTYCSRDDNFSTFRISNGKLLLKMDHQDRETAIWSPFTLLDRGILAAEKLKEDFLDKK
jgi:hypothetical protein